MMAEPKECRSNRSRKPKIHFDEIVQSSGPSKPSNAPKKPSAVPKKPSKTSKGSTKALPTTKSSKTLSETPLETPLDALDPPILDPIEELCSRIAELDIKAKKKAKSDEISRLTKLGFHGVLAEVKLLKEVEFEPFVPGDHQEPKLNIPSNIDPTDLLALLDLFIPTTIYATIVENTNLYAIAYNAPTSTTLQYWYPINEYEIRVLFGILYYIGVYREPNFRIY